ncbi:MAG: S41 family peptidase [Pseudomonadota bacterium]
MFANRATTTKTCTARSIAGRVFLAVGVSTVLASCGGGGSGSSGTSNPPVTSASCGVESQKEFVFSVAQDWYLWYDEMAPVSLADFDSAEALLSALTAPLAEDFRDPGFSYLTTVAADQANFSTGAFIGFGFRFGIDANGSYLISDAYESGNAQAAGFIRGAELLAVDTGSGFQSMQTYEAQGASISEVFGPSELGVERGFRLLVDGEVLEVVVAKSELDVPPLAAAPLSIDRAGLAPAGYIHLRSFTSSAIDELEAAFKTLSDEGVTDFVVDLRYNSGGLVEVAERFLDLLGGAVAERQIAYRLSYNEKRASEDFDYLFNDRPASVVPLRIAFLTSEATASASELLINSLAPFVEIALIGSDTSGKAVGQNAFDQNGCNTRLRLVAFETVNGEEQGEFYTGLVDTGRFTLCAVEDNFRGVFGSAEENLTAGALAWLGEGACPVSPVTSRTASTKTDRGFRRNSPSIAGRDLADRRSSWVQ